MCENVSHGIYEDRLQKICGAIDLYGRELWCSMGLLICDFEGTEIHAVVISVTTIDGQERNAGFHA